MFPYNRPSQVFRTAIWLMVESLARNKVQASRDAISVVGARGRGWCSHVDSGMALSCTWEAYLSNRTLRFTVPVESTSLPTPPTAVYFFNFLRTVILLSQSLLQCVCFILPGLSVAFNECPSVPFYSAVFDLLASTTRY